MIPKNTDKQWELYGKACPYYGVLTDEEFEPGNLDEKALADFFQSGERHLDYVLNIIKKHFDSDFRPVRCMDFGCGTGRLVIPMAKQFPEVVGIDVARAMLDEAQRNCERFGVENVEFILSDNKLSKVTGKFDLIHSVIVFQHIACDRGESVLRRMIDLLDSNGVAALHFTYYCTGPALYKWARWLYDSVPSVYNLINLARGRRFSHPSMTINYYNLNTIFQILQGNGCKSVHVRFSKHGVHSEVMLFFQKE